MDPVETSGVWRIYPNGLTNDAFLSWYHTIALLYILICKPRVMSENVAIFSSTFQVSVWDATIKYHLKSLQAY